MYLSGRTSSSALEGENFGINIWTLNEMFLNERISLSDSKSEKRKEIQNAKLILFYYYFIILF